MFTPLVVHSAGYGKKVVETHSPPWQSQLRSRDLKLDLFKYFQTISINLCNSRPQTKTEKIVAFCKFQTFSSFFSKCELGETSLNICDENITFTMKQCVLFYTALLNYAKKYPKAYYD